jgi:two-component system response regulator HydG/two-component system response regulator AtoC
MPNTYSTSSGPVEDRSFHDSIIGPSAVMCELKRDMLQIAKSASTVLITGETGTGKELAAELIHASSSRRKQAFLCINCAAIPDSLLESELFGHAKGAFTGADEYRDGLLVSANGGTIFLDEIGDMSLCAQAKILRVVEKRDVCRVGSNRGVHLDIRFIAATNHDLEAMANSGMFRKDLFFRLNVARIHLPPLRERREDIPFLWRHYCSDLTTRMGMATPEFSEDFLRCLQTYGWPGNIRELKNIVEALFLKDLPEKIGVEHLPRHLRGLIESRADLSQQERDALIKALFSAKWNKSEAAKKLHWSRMTLYRKIAKYQISANPSARPPGKQSGEL